MKKRKRSNTRRFAPLILIVPMLAFVGFGFYGSHRAKKSAQKPLPQQVAVPYWRKNQALPPMSEEELKTRVHAAMREVIATHRSREIREDLSALFSTGKVMLEWRGNMDTWEIAAASVVMWDKPGYGLLPVVGIDPRFWLDPNQDTRSKQTVLIHEYQHVRRLLDGADSPQWFMEGTKEVTALSTRMTYRAELAAYLGECRFLIREGWVDVDPRCATFVRDGERGLRKHLAAELAERLEYRAFRNLILTLPDADSSTP